MSEKTELGNGIVSRTGKPVRWSRRTKLWIAVACVLAISGGVLAYNYFSNPLTQTTVVSTYAITLSGNIPATGFLNVDVDVPFTASSNTGGDLPNAVLQVDVTRAGQAGDLSLKIAGNQITPTCSGNVCTYVGAIGTINPAPGNIGTTWNWKTAGTYSIVVTVKA